LPASLTLTAGSAGTSTSLTTHLSSGSSGFTVRASGVTGVSATPSTGTVGTPLALSLSAGAGTPSSTGTVSLALTASSLTATAAIAVTISGDDATLSAPSQLTVQPGASVQFQVTSATAHGQPQLLQLSTTGLPAGATATFNPPQITSGSSSMAIINVPAGATVGIVPVVIVGQGPVAKVTADLQLGVGTTFSSGCASADPIPLALLGLLAMFGASKRKRARMAAVRVF